MKRTHYVGCSFPPTVYLIVSPSKSLNVFRISNGFSSGHRHWGLPSLLSGGYRRPFHRGQSERGVKLTTHLHLVPRLRMRGAV